MTVVGYARVSTAEQATEGVSLDAQCAKIRGYAALHDLDLAGIEVDAGVSAKSLDRPAIRAALAALDRGDVAGLVIVKLDRLSRSIIDWNTLIEGYFGPAAGRQLFSVADSVDTRTAAGRMVLNIMMTIAQWERETTVERTADARAHKRSKGEAIGHAPYGQRLGPDGRTLIPDAAERATLAELRRWQAEGRTLRAMAAELDRRGVPTKRGARAWSHKVVAKILRAAASTTDVMGVAS